jgi:3-methylfumaryl-CoA hydratase
MSSTNPSRFVELRKQATGDKSMTVDIKHLRSWIDRTEVADDTVTLAPLRALSATLDREDAPRTTGDLLSPCWHWLYFLPVHRQSEIGPDGHARRGGCLPPVRLPRRMWAGSRIEFVSPLRVGQAITRTSRIQDVRLKEGRTGPLVFVNVRHETRGDGELAVNEEQDIVYRENPRAGEPTPAGVAAPADAHWTRRIVADDVLLFRYSALTFNGHRIHYDRRYVTTVEGYPGLVVHGPLIATLLLDLLRRHLPEARVTGFSFKAVKPIYDVAPFDVCGRLDEDDAGNKTVKLWARTPEGHVAMDAGATLA